MDGGRVPFLFVNFARLAAQLANGVKLHGGDYCNFLFKKTAIESFTDITYFVSFFLHLAKCGRV